jgi:dienelactone hydrolase
VQPEVKVLADGAYSYALYLPAKYSTQKRWPVLLAFDPSGIGVNPVKLFQPAAEKYGFIVVGSNNSRNFVDPSAAIRLLWQDVRTRYAIDPRRVYATGFSGGSRVASALAIGCKGCLAGVIACGAGLPQGVNIPAAKITEWFLTAGTIDFNYSEITQLADALDSRHAATHLEFFPGPHSWMPPAVAEEALAWMQLRAMVKATALLDNDFVESEFKRRVEKARSLQQSGEVLAAFRAYREIISDFESLRDITDIQARRNTLAGSDELKHARKNEQALFELENKTVASMGDITNAVLEKQKPPAMLYRQLESMVQDIRHDRETTQDAGRRDALTRALAGAFAYARESGSDNLLKKNYLQASDFFRAAALIRPESPGPHYLIAQANAHLGDNKTVLDELGKSADLGLSDTELLDQPDFSSLHNNDAFKAIIARVTANAAKQNN